MMTTKPIKPLPACDCLNDCGDDPRLARGAARPCQVYINHINTRNLHAASADLLASCIELLSITHPDLDEHKKATAAINKALKGKP